MKENLYTPNSIRTFTDEYVNVFNPDINTIKIEDIAHSLSNQCRFGAMMPKFYSVAQHSIFCADMIEKKYKLQALLHDASEAYISDICSPIKPKLIGYEEIEKQLSNIIYYKFFHSTHFDKIMIDTLKHADYQMLYIESKKLMSKNFMNYLEKPTVIPNLNFKCLNPEEAKFNFLQRYNELI